MYLKLTHNKHRYSLGILTLTGSDKFLSTSNSHYIYKNRTNMFYRLYIEIKHYTKIMQQQVKKTRFWKEGNKSIRS